MGRRGRHQLARHPKELATARAGLAGLPWLAARTAISMLLAFVLAVNGVWWIANTNRLARVLGDQLFVVLFRYLPPALWLWFTVVLALLVVPAVLAAWWLWRGKPRAGLALTVVAVAIAYGVTRWGTGVYPLVSGAGGYYIRTWPFGGY